MRPRRLPAGQNSGPSWGVTRSVSCGCPDRSRVHPAVEVGSRRAHQPDSGPARAPSTGPVASPGPGRRCTLWDYAGGHAGASRGEQGGIEDSPLHFWGRCSIWGLSRLMVCSLRRLHRRHRQPVILSLWQESVAMGYTSVAQSSHNGI